MFADDKVNLAQSRHFSRVKNTLEKGQNAGEAVFYSFSRNIKIRNRAVKGHLFITCIRVGTRKLVRINHCPGLSARWKYPCLYIPCGYSNRWETLTCRPFVCIAYRRPISLNNVDLHKLFGIVDIQIRSPFFDLRKVMTIPNQIAVTKFCETHRYSGWLVVLGFKVTLKAKVITWRSVTHMCFLAFSHRSSPIFLSHLYFRTQDLRNTVPVLYH